VTKYNTDKLALLVIVGCATFAWSGCNRQDNTQDQNADPFDIVEPGDEDMGSGQSEDMTSETPDMGAAPDMTAEVDMSGEELDMSEPEPDMRVEPLREVVDRRLFGTMAVENRVKDPRFDTINTAYTWYATYGAQSYRPRTVYRKVLAQTPEQAPVMHVPKDDGGQTRVYGEVALQAVPTQYSVWVGRKGISLDGNNAEPAVSVYGVNTKNPRSFGGITLDKDEDSGVTVDGISWFRYDAFSSDLAGYGFLVVDDPSSSRALYVHAPQVVFTPVGANALLPRMQAARSASEEESQNLHEIFAVIREQRERSMVPKERPVPHPF
jgi:hypothetical protein